MNSNSQIFEQFSWWLMAFKTAEFHLSILRATFVHVRGVQDYDEARKRRFKILCEFQISWLDNFVLPMCHVASTTDSYSLFISSEKKAPTWKMDLLELVHLMPYDKACQVLKILHHSLIRVSGRATIISLIHVISCMAWASCKRANPLPLLSSTRAQRRKTTNEALLCSTNWVI